MRTLDQQVSQATAELRLEKERTEAILRSVADSVIATDSNGNVLTTNPVAERLLADQPGLARQVRDTVVQMFARHEPTRTAEIEVGDLTFQANAAQVVEPLESQEGAVVVLRDFTRLYELDRLKNKFVSNVTHELRTPLTSIQLYVQLLREGKAERRTQYLDVLTSESARLARLISDLLDLSRLDQRVARPRELLNLGELLGAAVTTLRLQAEACQLALEFQIPAEPVFIMGNRDQLLQVWINLIGNAIRYTPVGGRISLDIVVSDHTANVEVHDSGIGISAEDQAHIFDRFYRGQQAGVTAVAGAGLGLSICKEIVELHRGTIGVQSTLGIGSIFRVTLPLAPMPEGEIITVNTSALQPPT
jgi:signal transduction histidine kinase